MTTIDETATRVARSLPASLQVLVARLPHRLGLVVSPEGRWEDFVQIESNRDLPRFTGLPVGALAPFSEAHRCAAIWGLIADRLADRQTPQDEDLVALRRIFRAEWEAQVALGLGDPVRARAYIQDALCGWREGLRLERAPLDGPSSTRRYVDSIIARLRWVTTSARAALDLAGHSAGADAIQRGYLAFLVALQLRDDALDVSEDAAIRGASIPDQLRLDPAALHAAAPFIARAASNTIRAQGFGELQRLVDDFADRIDRRPPSKQPVAAALGAALLMSATCEALGLPS